MARKNLGPLGENYATSYLRQQGFRIRERNYHTPRWGELDIVAEEGGVLVFVEVKTRTSLRYGLPEEALNFFKRRALKRACEYYLTAHQCSHLPCRLDLITILAEPQSLNIKKLEHFRDVPF